MKERPSGGAFLCGKKAEKKRNCAVFPFLFLGYSCAIEEKGENAVGYVQYNPNPACRRVGDCTVRAISKALGQDWETTYTALTLQGFLLSDMPTANHVWGAYLRHKGFIRRIMPEDCPDCYTVADFCADHPTGTYILAISGHVVCACDGDWHDTWDSGGEVPLYYWQKG